MSAHEVVWSAILSSLTPHRSNRSFGAQLKSSSSTLSTLRDGRRNGLFISVDERMGASRSLARRFALLTSPRSLEMTMLMSSSDCRPDMFNVRILGKNGCILSKNSPRPPTLSSRIQKSISHAPDLRSSNSSSQVDCA